MRFRESNIYFTPLTTPPNWGGGGGETQFQKKMHIYRVVDELNLLATLKKMDVIYEWPL